ncbi:MAG TPA: hypothetical protein DD412_01895, partial [Holosporales bacterium]|nr:hypothetical protein [Holosporales bacterium]
AVSMVSAGVCGELLKALDLSAAISGDIGQQVLSRTQETATRAGVNTVLKSTIDGRNFGDVLTEEARSGAASVVGGTLANKVGVEYKAKDSDINYVMHKIIHGVIGGVSGLISGGTEEAFASAIGATIGEIVGESYEKAHRGGVYDPQHPSFNAKEREDMVKKGTMFSELSAAVFAGVLGQDPNAAARAANTAVTENSFEFPEVVKHKLDEISTCEMEIDNLKDALDQATSPQERQALAVKVSQKEQQLLEARSYLGNSTENQRMFQKASDEAFGKFMATGAIEDETLLWWINPVDRFLDGIQESSSRVPLRFVPSELSSAPTGWDVLHYSQQAHLYQEMRVGQDFVRCVTNMARIPKNYYELGVMVAPFGATTKVTNALSTGFKAVGRSSANAFKKVPVFSRSTVQTPYLLTLDRVIPEGYHLRYLSNQTTPIMVRNPGQAFYLDQMTLQGGKPVPIFDIKQATSKIHGCSNAYVGETHVYVIRDSMGNAYKIGESMQGYTALDLSKRAEQQAQKLFLETGEIFETQVLHKFPTKKLAKDRETRTIKVLRKRNGEEALPGNLTNH